MVEDIRAILGFDHILYSRSPLVTGLTCAVEGEEAAKEWFPQSLWVDYVQSADDIAPAFARRLPPTQSDDDSRLVFMQNRGAVMAADSADKLTQMHDILLDRLGAIYGEKKIITELPTGMLEEETVLSQAPALRTLLGGTDCRATIVSSEYFDPALGPLTPEHAASGVDAVFYGELNQQAIDDCTNMHGEPPRLVAVENEVVFAAGAGLAEARSVMSAARDAALVRQLSQAFGGPFYLSEDDAKIAQATAETSARATAPVGNGRMRGRVCVVTGGAQGFGLGIAQGLAREGATVILADLNVEGASAAAAELDRKYGSGTALGVGVNIANEPSVEQMVQQIVKGCGGIDVLVANAGVLRAGSVKEMTMGDWDLVTAVNYTGYFLCAKHCSRIMAAQNVGDRGPWMDIVQINSKSGLEGSNRNGAYAGSKFGTIGLTQSFAKELVSDRIKVNSICPGNFFDGPLWSDPETGLFVQYLNTGKVPGARTVADVRREYEAKVPMGRGCTPEDVLCAILYAVEQRYETGQAIPVTGGQVMLK